MKKRNHRFNRWKWLILVIVALVGCAVPSTEETTATLPVTPKPAISTPEPTVTTVEQSLAAQEGSVTVDGYTFSPLQEVPDDLGRVDIIGWLPGSPDEIVAIQGYRVIAVNVHSGQIRGFSESFDSSIMPESVRLLKNGKVGFATYDTQAQTSDDWWVSGAEDEQAVAPIITESHPYPILSPDGESLIVYNINTQQANIVTQDGAVLQTESTLSSLLTSLTVSKTRDDRNWGFLSASSPASQWTAVFNMEYFSLVDLNTGESQGIDLGPLWTDAVYWSPDGQKLAMLAAEGGYGNLVFKKLFILDVESGQMKEIETGYQYVTNVTWSPDSENLLIAAKTGTAQAAQQGYEYKTSDLFWVDTLSDQVQLIPLLPEGTYVGLVWKLSWAPDGEKIAISATITRGNPQLYRIDVSKP